MKDKGTLPLSKTMQKLIRHKYAEMEAYGESRHEAKKEGTADWKIFAQKSMEDHIERFCNFAIWCRDAYGDKTLDDYKKHARNYVDFLIENGYKPSTISSYASSICKLYRVKKADFIGKTPPVERKGFEQSRKPSKREERFSFGKYGLAVDIIEVSGMRRDEYAKFRGKHYLGLRDIAINGKIETLHFVTVKGKGGKVREMPLIGDKEKIERVVAFFKSLGRNELAALHFKGMDNVGTHYRRRLYTQNALDFTRRDFNTCKKTPIYDPDKFNGKGKPKGGWRKNSVVYFRKEKAGEWEDRQAMFTVSEWLGHNRTNVMGKHYV